PMKLRDGGVVQASAAAAGLAPVASIWARIPALNLTLRPTPITTCAGPLASARTSIRIPPILRSSNQISFGHLSKMPEAPARSNARAIATPTHKLKAGLARDASVNDQFIDRAM